MYTKKTYLTVLAAMLVSGCGGGGGGMGGGDSTPMTPPPVVSLSASPMSVLLTETSTLTWSSSNATSCSASDSWSGTKTTSGSEAVTISTAGNNSFTLSCSGAGGSGSSSVTVEGYRNSSGVVVDGYISGADIFIDEDGDWIAGSNESSTTSDNDGKFTIKYANGNLVSIGGTDLDSQTLLDNLLITHKLTGHTDFKAVTPVTSVSTFMTDSANVNAALGIDSTIDVSIFDPVANKGDGGVNDYLYEKGNQLTVLAYALQNITNDLNTTTETTQDYFKAITEEIETEFTETETKVDIENEAFITKVLNNVVAEKSVTIDETAKTNTTKALASVLPVIEVKSSDDLTTGVIRFAVSTLQTDIQAIANGTATAETITSYTSDVLTYIAEDQDIDADEIAPNINAIEDTASTSQDTAVEINVLLNDSYLTSSPISVTAGNGSNGTTSVASNIVTYDPDTDYKGTDTFSYTVTQGDKTSSATVTVTVISTESNTIFGDILPSSVEIDLTKSEANLIIEVEFEDSVGINIENLPIAEIIYESSAIDTSGIQLSGSSSSNYSKYKYLKLSQWRLQSGNSNKGIFRANGTLPQYLRGGFYDINSGYFYDNNGYGKNKTQNKAIKLIIEGDAPELSNLTISSTEVDVSSEAKTITLTVNAKDVSGINLDNLPTARIDAKGGSGSINAGSKWTLKSGTEYEGIYETTITISKDAVADDYLVATGNFYDVHRNLYYLLSLYGSDSGGITINSEVEGDAPELSNLTISSTEVDITNEAKTITLTVSAKDVSGINLDNLPTARIDAKGGSGSINAGSKWTLKSGTEYEGIYETTITISKDAVAGDYLVATGNFYDVHGSFSYILTGYGVSDNGITVTSSKEGVVPNVSVFTVTPNKIYVLSESATINLTIKASDESGIDDSRLAKPSIYQQNGALSISSDKEWERVSGDIYDGTYLASITVPKGSIPGSYSINSGYFYDVNSNFSYENSLYGSASGGLDIFNEDAPVNTAPVFTSVTTFSAAENQTAIDTVTATDADGDSVTFTVSGSELAITSAGVLTFASAPDYETKATYTATVTATDGTNSTTQAITVNVTDVVENSSPVFTSNSSYTVAENQTSAANITVTDADSDSISFSLSGTDADSFTISSSGALTFNNAPDYETKESYSLIITASDGSSSVSQTINISITNVNEVPQISALSSTQTPDENQLSVATISASDPDASSTLTYSVSGTDSSLFTISSSGVLTFRVAPDYETPGDADGDNNYQINIIVTDGSLSVTQAITIQVQNVADLISGVAVDGYVAGATVFQDLNNDGDLDSGEPSAATNSLGSFSLNLSSVNINAPVRIINGFDLASNEIHPSIMDISVSETGSYIVTPISTLVGRLKIQDTALSAMVPQSMIAGALGISLADSPNDSILGFDPIAYFNSSDTTLASEARPVFAASQLLMTMGGGNYSIHKYITDQALSALSSTLTTAAGTSITLSSASDIIGLKQDAYDAIFNGYVDTALANNPPINNIQFKNNKAVMTDYVNGSSSSAVNYSLYGVHDGSTTLVADLVGAKLDYDNLKQILDNDGTGTPMDLNFELANIPAAGSGSTGVTLKLFMGADTTQASDEDYLQIALTANWESDGTNFTIKLPASSSITASFFDRSGTTLSITPTNQVEDIFTVTQDGPNRPATLSLRLSKLFNAFPTEVTGLSSFLDGVAEFTYLVEFDNFSIYDHLDNTFTKIQGTFAVDANPGITVFADDIYVHENATSKDISFYLSQAASSDVTLDYAIADASSASSSDYTLSAGTITIPAGSMSTTLTIPVTNDTTVEAQEEIRLTLSNVQNAVLGRSSVSAFITDGEEILANSTQKAILADNIFKDSKASINAYIKNKLDTTTITISGTSYTYSQVLVNNSITSDVYAYLDSIIDDYEVMSETLISTIMTKADAYIDSQLSSFASYTGFATGLTQLNSGIKGLNMSQIVGTNINSNGTFPSGQNATTLQTALDGKVDTLVTLAADTVADILGTDTNTNFPNANVVMGTDGDDTITGTSGSDLIASFGGTDTVNGLAGNDKILGGAGVDTLNGGDDNDHLYGYAGADTLNGNAGDDLIYGGKDDDTIDGDAGDDSLYGEAGDDTITSGAGNDTLDGGLGDDTINIDGTGNKAITGNIGTDTLNINLSINLEDFVSLTYDGGTATDGTFTLVPASGSSIEFTGIETLTVNSVTWEIIYVGSNGARSDVLGDGASSESSIFYSAATDKIVAFDNGNQANISVLRIRDTDDRADALSIWGSSNTDYIIQTSGSGYGATTVRAGAGNDQINMANNGLADTIYAGAGDDAVFLDNEDLTSDTVVDGEAGSDTLVFNFAGAAVTYTLNANVPTNFENLVGTTGNDTLIGDTNANDIRGGQGADTISGGDGNDALYGGVTAYQADTGSNGGWSDDYGWSSYPGYNGGQGGGLSKSIWYAHRGDGGNDTLYGNAGNDTLYGASGNDTLDGGTGADILAGGPGADTFIIRAGDGGSSITDADIIYDFTDGTDLIGMSGLEYTQLTREQGTGDYANHVIVKKTDTGEFLLIIQNTSLSSISNADFSAI
ncbi:cadherin domain-containing protein [Gammaproteobacteria bacterium]|nr:cadherin domain-containing protein [Gammaproteobacteria bacterium]